jgi:hypothetical protein
VVLAVPTDEVAALVRAATDRLSVAVRAAPAGETATGGA